MPAKIDISGQRFGRLTVVCEAGRKGGKVTRICRCDCGNEHIAKGRDLRCGDVKSCGCIQPNYGKHVIGTRLYSIWKAMRKRCSNPNDSCWRIYGGKGIKVCDEWMNSFDAFKSWSLENGYSDDLSIDRINSCGNYLLANRSLSGSCRLLRRSIGIACRICPVKDAVQQRWRPKLILLRVRRFGGSGRFVLGVNEPDRNVENILDGIQHQGSPPVVFPRPSFTE